MVSFLVDYIILSCLFNIPYYGFDCENKVTSYVDTLRKKMIEEIEKKDPKNKILQELKESQFLFNQNRATDTLITMKLIKDLIVFPLNLLVICIIILSKLSEKIMD